MLRTFRHNIKGRFGKVILAIIIVPFVLFGAESLLSGGGGAPAVVEINGEVIDEQQLAQEISFVRSEMAARMGENVDYAQLTENKLVPIATERLTQSLLLMQYAKQFDMAAPEVMLQSTIVNTPAFQIEGKFSTEQMNRAVASKGLNLTLLKSKLAEQVIASQFNTGMLNSGFATEKEAVLLLNVINESREIDWIALNADSYKKEIKVSEDDLQALYVASKNEFMTELMVDAEYILVSIDDFKKPVDDEVVLAEYTVQKERFVSIEERQVSHILFEINDDQDETLAKQRATEMLEKLDQGQTFGDLAKEFSQDSGSASDGGDLGYTERDGTFPEAFEDAAFSLSQGDVSTPVVTDAGVHLIKVVDIQSAEMESFDKLRESIVNDIQERQARKQYIELTAELADVAFNAENLNDPAETFELQVLSASNITKSVGGASAQALNRSVVEKAIFNDDRVRQALFSDELLDEGLNSALIELSENKSIVLRTASVHQPRQLKLDEVRDELISREINIRSEKKVMEVLASIESKVSQGEAFSDIAKEMEIAFNEEKKITRQSVEMERFAIDAVFAAPRSTVSKGLHTATSDGAGKAYLFALKGIESGDKVSTEQLKKIFAQQAETLFSRQDITAFMDSLQRSASIEKI